MNPIALLALISELYERVADRTAERDAAVAENEQLHLTIHQLQTESSSAVS